MEEQYNSALFKLVERAVSPFPQSADRQPEAQEEVNANISETLGIDLPSRLKQTLRTPKDALADDLMAEAKAIRDYLDGRATGLSWTPQLNNPSGNKEMIEALENKSRALQLSVATILLSDRKGVYTHALMRAIRMLAKSTEVPSGTTYNRIGEALRYYPLGLMLYTIFTCGVVGDRGDGVNAVLS